MEKSLPAIPAKRYFTIGEVSELCGVKPYVLRYWEQEFTQLKPMKRRGNRRYYQHHEVLLIRRIRELLYEQGFTISGARNRLVDGHHGRAETLRRSQPELESESNPAEDGTDGVEAVDAFDALPQTPVNGAAPEAAQAPSGTLSTMQVRQELISIRGLLAG
jgi:DNA-binding transcriptional MerR regulator